MNKLHIIVGNVGSGKTTYSKHLYYTRFVCMGHKVFAVNDDDLTSMLNIGQYSIPFFTSEYWKVYDKVRIGIVESLMQLEEKHEIIFDGFTPSRESRKPLLDLAIKYGYEVTLHVYNGPDNLDNRIENCRAQEEFVWKRVHGRFKSLYESPSEDEGIIYLFGHKKGF